LVQGEENTGSISIWVIADTENPYLELNYNYNRSPINYRVTFVTVPSNLGKGNVWSSFVLLPGNVAENYIKLAKGFYIVKLSKGASIKSKFKVNTTHI